MKVTEATKRRIAFDMDGVFANYHEPFVGFYNRRNGTNFNIGDIGGYDFWRAFGISEEKSAREITDFYFSEDFEEINPVEGSQDTIKLLSQKNILAIITARPDFIRERTLEWINKHFPNVFSDAHFTSQFGGNGSKKKKSDFCLDNGYEVIIEDSAEYANECAERGINALLLNRPWNRNGSLHPQVQRVSNWKEILEHLT